MPAAKATSRKRKSRDEDEEEFEPVKASKTSEDTSPKTKSSKKTASASKKQATSSNVSDEDQDDAVETSENGEDTVTTDFSTPSLNKGEIKIISWNVAGFGAIMKKGFKEYLESENPDIICLQETKISPEKVPTFAGYHAYFFECQRKGLHGTGLLTKIKPLSVELFDKFDTEGRIIIAEYETFYLVNTYVPNSGMKLDNLPSRLAWDRKLATHFVELQKKKPIVWCGDLNVARNEIDLKNPKTNTKSAGFTPQERASFEETIKKVGLVDSYRHFAGNETDCYTFWSYRFNSRAKNVGWRVDYFMVSESFMPQVTQSYIRKHVIGSEYV